MQQPVFPVILSGGSGSRLWPLSRQSYPKQFIPLLNERSLLQNTVERLTHIADLQSPITICHEDHRFVLAQQMQEMDVHPAVAILEPVSRNTAPAIAAAALAAQQQCAGGEDPILLVLPADHIITGEGFGQAVAVAVSAASQGRLVTFGITPDAPATGYGYIKRGAPLMLEQGLFSAEGFIEKPGLDQAKEFLNQGDYLWNSGIFVFSAQTYLKVLEQEAPEVHTAATKAWHIAAYDNDFIRLNESAFAESPIISVDYAVMESASDIVVVELNARWLDVGSWASLASLDNQDKEGNSTHGDVMLHDVQNTYVRSNTHLIAALGVKDLVIVDTADALLVADKKSTEDIRFIVTKLDQRKRSEHKIHKLVHRPWGSYECLQGGDGYLVKHIIVKPKHALSLQSHKHRAEHWVVVQGTARVTCDNKTYLLDQNESTFIPLGAKHRLENLGNTPLELIEVQSGAYIDEDDIIRYEDNYGRNVTK